MRQIVLDTETTGLELTEGHRIIEIGCVELVNRRRSSHTLHYFLNPEREIDEGAIAVHGITPEQLANRPRFGDIAREFLDFIRDAEIIIHNAPFDVGFINEELKRLGETWGSFHQYCRITDTLALARGMHPGQRNSLDALCKRYNVDNSAREWHGALLDAEILSDVYLRMTGGQVNLILDDSPAMRNEERRVSLRSTLERLVLRVVLPDEDENARHQARLETIDQVSGGRCLWRQMAAADTELHASV